MKRTESPAPPTLRQSGQIETRKPDADSIVADLTSKDPIRRTDARRMLGLVGRQAAPGLIALLKHPNSRTRWEAAKALACIADPRSARALVEALEDRDRDVRWLAAVALIALGRESLTPLLEALHDHPDSDWLRRGAHHVFHDLSQSSLANVAAPVLNALNAPEPEASIPPAVYHARKLLQEEGTSHEIG